MAAVTSRLPAPDLRRPRTVMVGTAFAAAASAMVYFGILAVYVSRRAEARETGVEWFPEGVVELGPSGWIFWTFVLSAFTIQWAVQAINNQDRPNAYVALGITAPPHLALEGGELGPGACLTGLLAKGLGATADRVALFVEVALVGPCVEHTDGLAHTGQAP